MALANNNITTTLVSQAIGYSSSNIGHLIADENNSTYAFKIVENGYSTNDGTLILTKKPKWNIFSNNSAGEWKLPSNSDGTIYFRLKRSPYDSNRYAFLLGSFRGYNHSALTPSIDIDNLNGEYDFPRRFADVNLDFIFHAKLGEYNWTTLAANASDIKLMIYDNSNTLILETPNVVIYPFYANGDTTFHYDFDVNLQYTGVYNYKVRAALTNSNSTILGFLPFDGNITIEVFEPDVRELSINFAENYDILYSGVYTQQNQFYQFAYPAAGVNELGTWNLTSIQYLTYNKSDDSLVDSLTVLPIDFNTNDSPQQIVDLYDGVEISITCDDSRVTLTKNQYLKIKLNYE